MNEINIYEDSRNRGLEILLHHPEENLDNDDRFKFKIKIPIFQWTFNFQIEFFMTKKTKFLEKE